MANTPFDSLESAHEYVRLLASEIEEASADIQLDIVDATRDQAARRLDALHMVDYKLKQLAQHMSASRRLLNDLRLLRRLLVGDGAVAGETTQQGIEEASGMR
jgi:hypothetical protein